MKLRGGIAAAIGGVLAVALGSILWTPWRAEEGLAPAAREAETRDMRRAAPERSDVRPPPKVQAIPAPPRPESPPDRSSVEPPVAPLAALEGLELATVDDGTREQLGVPRSDQIGRGVLVTRVHPDSPGAEIDLRPKDVIVRAQRKPVDELSDLEQIVRGRDHTLLIVARNGRLYELVIKPPFVP